MIVKYIKDSILNTHCKVIAHGVNCQNIMGSGVAKVLFEKYPQVKTEYHDFCNRNIPRCINGQEDLLGSVNTVDCGDKIILNCFTQENYGYGGKKYLSYKAIADIFHHQIEHSYSEIAIPKIGCGLAGGDWEAVEAIINLAAPETDVYVYYL